jgi:hypothetical protein
MKSGLRVVIFGSLIALAFGLTASLVASAGDTVTNARPSGFEREANFFEMLKWPNKPVGVFDHGQVPSWNLDDISAYLPMDGIEFADVNHRFEGHVDRARIIRELKLRKGGVFEAFGHLSYIYSNKLYSELRFSRPSADITTAELANWYRLSFKRLGEKAVIVRWEYLAFEASD